MVTINSFPLTANNRISDPPAPFIHEKKFLVDHGEKFYYSGILTFCIIK